jgi:hypothetical protein
MAAERAKFCRMRPRIVGPITQNEVHIVLLCVGGVLAMSLAFSQCAAAPGDDAFHANIARDVVRR